MMASAYDIAVENADGVTIYYNYINDGNELEVTNKGIDGSYESSVVIPEEVTYMTRTRKVTSIGANAFYGCSGLTSVTIPNSVTEIGDGAFHLCFGLTSVTIPNSVKSIRSSAFSNCIGLTSVTIGNSVTSIGEWGFNSCSHLASVTIGNSVTEIGWSAFRGCSSLTSVTLPNSLTSIGGYAFSKCYGLTTVTIPDSVTEIKQGAFESCSGLKAVTIGNSVESIENSSFAFCSGLKNVYCYAESVPTTDQGTFTFSPASSATLHVPAVSLEKYKAILPWNTFGSIVALTDAETAVKGIKSTQQNTDGLSDCKYLKNGKLIIIKDGEKYDAAGRH